MRKLLTTLTLAVTLAFVPTASAADGWDTFHNEEFGFSMPVPDGMTLKGLRLGKWGGLHGRVDGAEVWAIGRLGEQVPRETIEAFGVGITKVPGKYWLVVDSKEKTGGWTWFRVAVATNGKDVLWAKYGTGPKGSYLVVVKSTLAFSRTHATEMRNFAEGIVLD
jgi:hypothetical protein